jgi:hypothetical protein
LAFGRCLRFARDGWSVARLVEPSQATVDTMRQLSDRLLRAGAPAALPVLMFANSGGVYEKTEAELDQFGAVIDSHSFGKLETLTVIFSGIAAGAAPCFSVASANGLAG